MLAQEFEGMAIHFESRHHERRVCGSAKPNKFKYIGVGKRLPDIDFLLENLFKSTSDMRLQRDQ